MSRYKKQLIKKGRHAVRFWDRYWMPVRNKDFILYAWMYGPGLKYDYGNSNNLDWNKFAGVQLDLYRPHGRTIMPVFRYNQNLHVMEWTFYYHNILDGLRHYDQVGSVPGYVDETNMMHTSIGEVPIIYFQFANDQQVRVRMEAQNRSSIQDMVTFKRFGSYHTRGNAWWGGNQTAQDDVEFQKRYTK